MKRAMTLVFGQQYTIRGVAGGILVAVICIVSSLGLMNLSSRIVQKQAVETKAEAPKVEVPPLPVRAIVICCSDPRFDMIDRIRERYGLKKGEAFPIVVPGGPDPLANPELMEYKCLSEKIDLDIILEHPSTTLKTIIVAEHEDCACIKHFGLTEDPHQGKKDFPAIKEFFIHNAPDLKLEMLYYSFFVEGKGKVNPEPEVITVADE